MNNVTPKCPHCGYKYSRVQTFYSSYNIGCDDGDVTDLKCHSCGKPWKTKCIVNIRFIAVDERMR